MVHTLVWKILKCKSSARVLRTKPNPFLNESLTLPVYFPGSTGTRDSKATIGCVNIPDPTGMIVGCYQHCTRSALHEESFQYPPNAQ